MTEDQLVEAGKDLKKSLYKAIIALSYQYPERDDRREELLKTLDCTKQELARFLVKFQTETPDYKEIEA